MFGVLAYSAAVCLEGVIVFPALYPRLVRMAESTAIDNANAQRTAAFWTGVCMACFSGGRALAALVLNLREHDNRSIRWAATGCFACSLVASVFFVFAASAPALAATRFAGGLGAGALSLMLVSLVTSSSEAGRSLALSNYYLAAAVGEISGPLLLWASSGVDWRLRWLPADNELVINQFNIAGVWTALIFCACFATVIRSLSVDRGGRDSGGTHSDVDGDGNNDDSNSGSDGDVEAVAEGGRAYAGRSAYGKVPIDAFGRSGEEDAENVDAWTRSGSSNDLRQPLVDPNSPQEMAQPRPHASREENGNARADVDDDVDVPLSCSLLSWELIFLGLANVATNFAVAAWETVVTPLGALFFGWGVEENSLLFVVSGIVLLVSSLLVRLAKFLGLSDFVGSVCSVGLAAVGAGVVLFGSLENAGHFWGGQIVFVSANAAFTLGIYCLLTFFASLYTKAIIKRPGFFVGLLRTASAVSRVLGNLSSSVAVSSDAGGSGAAGPLSAGAAATTLAACPLAMILLLVAIFFSSRK